MPVPPTRACGASARAKRSRAAGWSSRIRLEPLRASYRELDILAVPGPSGAVTAVELLNLLEASDLDTRIPEKVRDELATMGHELELREETFFSSHFARPSAIRIERDGTLRGGANPLKPALAAGLE